jgi:hypothetical protein
MRMSNFDDDALLSVQNKRLSWEKNYEGKKGTWSRYRWNGNGKNVGRR